uniref:Uncharacterized protein n=1 Tax=Pseudomonas phage Cygsa01 TaxID=3138529 RepID=A0AAU6W3X4_9VIRU
MTQYEITPGASITGALTLPTLIPQNWFDDGGWYERLLQALRKLCYENRDCLVAQNSDEIQTWNLVMAEMARHTVRQLGAGPYSVMHAFGSEEVPHLGTIDQVVETSAHGVVLQGVGQDPYGFQGQITVHRLPARVRAVQLYQYADGGPPPVMIIMLADEVYDLRDEDNERLSHCDRMQVD